MYHFDRDVRGEGSQVIFDFSYFKNSDSIEAAIEKDAKIQDVDAMVKEEHLDNLRRFYQAIKNAMRDIHIKYLFTFSVLNQFTGTAWT